MLARSVLSLERELRDKDRTIHKLHREIRELQRERDDRREAWALLPSDYSEVFVELHHIAFHGVRSGEGGADPNGPSSNPPIHDAVAYSRLQSESRSLVTRGQHLGRFLDDIIDPAKTTKRAS